MSETRTEMLAGRRLRHLADAIDDLSPREVTVEIDQVRAAMAHAVAKAGRLAAKARDAGEHELVDAAWAIVGLLGDRPEEHDGYECE